MSIPERLGKYRIERRLGAGGMGEVFVAVDEALGRKVALKTLLGLDLDSLERFGREASLLAKVEHPAVITVHSLERDGATPFLVTELIDGEPFSALTKGGPLPWEEAVPLVCELAEGVAAIHAAGILHRDLKPDNAMRRSDGSAVVLDFGLAREQDGESLTQTGAILGTPTYMPPEQALGAKVTATDARADVYGLACILFYLLSGRPPFANGPLITVINAVIHHPPDWAALKGVHPPVREVLKRGLAKAPDQRPGSVLELRDLLLEASSAPAPAAWTRALPFAAAGALLLGLALALVVSGTPDPEPLSKREAPISPEPGPGAQARPAIPQPGPERLARYRAVLSEAPSKARSDDLARLTGSPLWTFRPGGRSAPSSEGLNPAVGPSESRRLRVAFAGPDTLYLSSDAWDQRGLVRLDLKNGSARPVRPPQRYVSRHFAVTRRPKGFELWRAGEGGLLREGPEPLKLTVPTFDRVRVSPRGERIALTGDVRGGGCWLKVFDREGRELLDHGLPNAIQDLVFISQDRLAVASNTKSVFGEGGVFLLEVGAKPSPRPVIERAGISRLAWSARHQLLAIGQTNGDVALYDVARGRLQENLDPQPPLQSRESKTTEVRAIAFDGDALWWVASQTPDDETVDCQERLRRYSISTATLERPDLAFPAHELAVEAGVLVLGGFRDGRLEFRAVPPRPEPPGPEALRQHLSTGQRDHEVLWEGPATTPPGIHPLLATVDGRLLVGRREHKEVLEYDLGPRGGPPRRIPLPDSLTALHAARLGGRATGLAVVWAGNRRQVLSWTLGDPAAGLTLVADDLPESTSQVRGMPDGAVVGVSSTGGQGAIFVARPGRAPQRIDVAAELEDVIPVGPRRVVYTTKSIRGTIRGYWRTLDLETLAQGPRRWAPHSSWCAGAFAAGAGPRGQDLLAVSIRESQVRILEYPSGNLLHSLDLLWATQRDQPSPVHHRPRSLTFLRGGALFAAVIGKAGQSESKRSPWPLRYLSTLSGEVVAEADLPISPNALVGLERGVVALGGFKGDLHVRTLPALRPASQPAPPTLSPAIRAPGPERVRAFVELSDAQRRTPPDAPGAARLEQELEGLRSAPLFTLKRTQAAVDGWPEQGDNGNLAACKARFLDDHRLIFHRGSESQSLQALDLLTGEVSPVLEASQQLLHFSVYRLPDGAWRLLRLGQGGRSAHLATLRWPDDGPPRLEDQRTLLDLEDYGDDARRKNAPSNEIPYLQTSAISDSGRWVALGGTLSSVVVIDLQGIQPPRLLKTDLPERIAKLAFHGELLVAGAGKPKPGSLGSKLLAWRVSDWKPVATRAMLRTDATALASDPLEQRFLVGDGDGGLLLLSGPEGLEGKGQPLGKQQLGMNYAHFGTAVYRVLLSHDGRRALTVTGKGNTPLELGLWDLDKGQQLDAPLPKLEVRQIRGEPVSIDDADASPNRRLLVLSFKDESLQVWASPLDAR